jgi:hypothetical protein
MLSRRMDARTATHSAVVLLLLTLKDRRKSSSFLAGQVIHRFSTGLLTAFPQGDSTQGIGCTVLLRDRAPRGDGPRSRVEGSSHGNIFAGSPLRVSSAEACRSGQNLRAGAGERNWDAGTRATRTASYGAWTNIKSRSRDVLDQSSRLPLLTESYHFPARVQDQTSVRRAGVRYRGTECARFDGRDMGRDACSTQRSSPAAEPHSRPVWARDVPDARRTRGEASAAPATASFRDPGGRGARASARPQARTTAATLTACCRGRCSSRSLWHCTSAVRPAARARGSGSASGK